jgi:hypothetical protein
MCQTIRIGAGVLAALLALVAVLPAVALPAGRVSLVTKWTQEPALAIDPLDPKTILIGTNNNQTVTPAAPYSVAYYLSHDGGRTFRAAPVPIRGPYTSAADPSVAYAATGTAFFGYLAEGQGRCGAPPPNNAIMVTAGRDAFRAPAVVDVNSQDDRPYLAVESVPGRHSHVFIAWTRFEHGAEIWVARSNDGGVTFGSPQMLYTSEWDNFGAVPVVGPHHTIYVFWASVAATTDHSVGAGRIYMSVSHDDGVTFEPAISIVPEFRSVPRLLEPDSLRVISPVGVAATPGGRLYVTWAGVRVDEGGGAVSDDIFVTTSTTEGRRWAAPRVVNDVAAGDRFMPSVTAYPDGSAGVAFYDRRDGYMDVFAARVSFKGGFAVSPNLRVNANRALATDIYQEPKPTQQAQSRCFGYSPGRFFGDYLSTARDNRGAFYVAWGDAGMHVYAQTDIWLARTSLPAVQEAAR